VTGKQDVRCIGIATAQRRARAARRVGLAGIDGILRCIEIGIRRTRGEHEQHEVAHAPAWCTRSARATLRIVTAWQLEWPETISDDDAGRQAPTRRRTLRPMDLEA